MELYGVSPGVIAIIMLIVTLLVPYGFILEGFFVSSVWSGPVLYSFIWVYQMNSYYAFGLRILFPDIIATLPLCVLNIVYALWIVRCYQAKSTKYMAIMIGILSILLPTAIIFYITSLFAYATVIFPIPIQFVIGLVILWRIEGPEVISPWSGMRLDLSWWKRKEPKRKDDWDPFENEKKTEENENNLKLTTKGSDSL